VIWDVPKNLQHNVILSAVKDLADEGDSSLRSEWQLAADVAGFLGRAIWYALRRQTSNGRLLDPSLWFE